MNYKEKAQILRSCSGVNGHTCSSCPAFGKGNRTCRSNAMKDGANCIETLLERVESAEVRAEKAEKDFADMREAWDMYGGEDGIKAAFQKAEDLHRQLEELKKKYGDALYSI